MLLDIKVAIIGGTGKSGNFLVRELIQQKIPFRILLRNPAAYSLPAGDPFKGDARDAESVSQLLEGCAAVISTCRSSV
jgi:uncharacterized protein YbjT (DUF2867 family)